MVMYPPKSYSQRYVVCAITAFKVLYSVWYWQDEIVTVPDDGASALAYADVFKHCDQDKFVAKNAIVKNIGVGEISRSLRYPFFIVWVWVWGG